MKKLLYIQSSPRGDRAASVAVAKEFIRNYLEKYPTDTIETLNLWQAELPEFSDTALDAKYAVLNGNTHSADQHSAWRAVAEVAEHFKSADKFIISVPMWNFSIPYKLKYYIDILNQPELTFSFSSADGFRGLVTGKPMVIIYARGGCLWSRLWV